MRTLQVRLARAAGHMWEGVGGRGLRRRADCSQEALAVADSVVVVLELAAVDEVLVSFGLAAAAALAVGGGGGLADGGDAVLPAVVLLERLPLDGAVAEAVRKMPVEAIYSSRCSAKAKVETSYDMSAQLFDEAG